MITSLLASGVNLFSNVVNNWGQHSLLKQQQQALSGLSEQQQQTLREITDKHQQTQLKLEYLKINSKTELEQNRQTLQEKLAQLNHQQTKEVQAFIKSVDLAISQKNLNFQNWRFEQEKVLQKQLADYTRETQLLIAQFQRETTLKLPEVNKLFDNYPLRIVPNLILNSHHSEKLIPLKIIIAPPEVDFDAFSHSSQEFPKISKSLGEGLRQFLNKHYPLNSETRPTDFLDGAWDSKKFHGGSSIKVLFEILKSEPILILESEVEGDYLNFRVAYWGLGARTYTYESVISKLPYKEILYKSAKERARKWKLIRDKLLELGKSLEEIKQLGKIDYVNLKTLEEAEELQRHGLDISQISFEYKLKNDDFENLNRLLTYWHCLITGLIVDTYYLVYYNHSPISHKIIFNLINDLENYSVFNLENSDLINELKNYKVFNLENSDLISVWYQKILKIIKLCILLKTDCHNAVLGFQLEIAQFDLKVFLKQSGIQDIPSNELDPPAFLETNCHNAVLRFQLEIAHFDLKVLLNQSGIQDIPSDELDPPAFLEPEEDDYVNNYEDYYPKNLYDNIDENCLPLEVSNNIPYEKYDAEQDYYGDDYSHYTDYTNEQNYELFLRHCEQYDWEEYLEIYGEKNKLDLDNFSCQEKSNQMEEDYDYEGYDYENYEGYDYEAEAMDLERYYETEAWYRRGFC